VVGGGVNGGCTFAPVKKIFTIVRWSLVHYFNCM